MDTFLSILPMELTEVVVRYGEHLADACTHVFSAEEMSWLLRTHKKLAIAGYGAYRAERWIEESGELCADTLSANVSERVKYFHGHGSHPGGLLGCTPNSETKMLDVSSVFRLMQWRLKCLGRERSIALVREQAQKFLSSIYYRYLSDHPVFLEMYLCACIVMLGPVSERTIATHGGWPLYAPRGGLLSDLRPGITQRCSEHFHTLADVIEMMED